MRGAVALNTGESGVADSHGAAPHALMVEEDHRAKRALHEAHAGDDPHHERHVVVSDAPSVDTPLGSDPASRAALRLADALMTQPSEIDRALRDELRRHFTAEQIVELTLDVMKWNYQKVAVALRIDAEVRPGVITELMFDDLGHWVRPT